MIEKSGGIYQEKEWYCLSCPGWVWPNSWFNELTQFEHLIKRQEEKWN